MPTRSLSPLERAPRAATASERPSSRRPRSRANGRRADARAPSDGAAVGKRVASAALLLLAVLGCRRSAPATPPPPLTTLGAVTVLDVTPPDEEPARLDGATLGRALRTRLLATRQFEPASPDASDTGDATKAVTRVSVQVGLDGAEVGDKGLARTHVLLRLTTRPEQAPGAIAEELEATGEQRYAVTRGVDRNALFAALVERVAGDLLESFATRRRLARGSAEALHAAMLADGGDVRLEAIRLIGERHLTSEAPALLPLLDDPDETTRDTALGALIALGDRRAVTALTRSRSLRDRREMSKIIEAISILGGEEADDYLGFIASSHDDDEIRAEAKAARERLQRRRVDGAANQP